MSQETLKKIKIKIHINKLVTKQKLVYDSKETDGVQIGTLPACMRGW